MDKNPESVTAGELVWERLGGSVPLVVACSDPFHKAEFLEVLVRDTGGQVVFADLDCLYSGYVESGMVPRAENLTLVRPRKDGWEGEFAGLVSLASSKKSLVIVDSLNGMHRMFGGPDSARFVNSALMMLASLCSQAGSPVIVTAMAREREGAWVLSPGGKQLVRSPKTSVFYATKEGGGLVLAELGGQGSRRFLVGAAGPS